MVSLDVNLGPYVYARHVDYWRNPDDILRVVGLEGGRPTLHGYEGRCVKVSSIQSPAQPWLPSYPRLNVLWPEDGVTQ